MKGIVFMFPDLRKHSDEIDQLRLGYELAELTNYQFEDYKRMKFNITPEEM